MSDETKRCGLGVADCKDEALRLYRENSSLRAEVKRLRRRLRRTPTERTRVKP